MLIQRASVSPRATRESIVKGEASQRRQNTQSKRIGHMEVPSVIWKRSREKRRQDSTPRGSIRSGGSASVRRRSLGPERLEPRRLLAADPIHVGVVYIETDYLESDQDVGSDSRGDRFILSFTGGAPDTELSELRIRTDKEGDGISVGDPIYDTAPGGRGKNGAHGFQIVRVLTSDGHSIDAIAEVDDGGQELVLRLSNFRAGDRLEFTIDVDEVLRNAIDLAIFNDRLDVITSGQEFQDSVLEATFNAPHYEASHADAVFLNDYGNEDALHGLNLPPDEGSDVYSRPDRSAAAVASTTQVPAPIEISGHVWLDHDLDAVREPGESMLAGVEISLWKMDDTGNYVDTTHRATTDAEGRYLFSKSLGLMPGRYRLAESQPDGLFSVAAVAGKVAGTTTGRVESADVIVDIEIPLGDMSAIDYDFGEAAPASIAGNVYRDNNNDGLRDSTEVGISGIRVSLVPIHTIAPQSTLTVTTAEDGSYKFTGLAPGEYEVIEVDQPSNLNDGIDAAGTVSGSVVGIAENPGDRIHEILLAGSDAGIEYNFGEVPFGSISGFVYIAAPGSDCNGQHDAEGTAPLAGVEVILQTGAGVTIARTTTGIDGGYKFDNVSVGNYKIVELTPAGLIDGSSHAGRISNVQIGTSVDGGLIQDITMTPAGIGVEYNFCEAAPASISGYVYHDRSDDGIRDASETPIPGTRVSLVDAAGKEVASDTTDNLGRYEFINVAPGEYSIVESQPIGYIDGIDSVGTIRGQFVGDATTNDALTAIRLRQGDSGREYNFGERLAASLFGRVHVDIDEDCELDAGEQTLSGVTIRLLDSSGTEIASTQTDVDGRYAFENLEPGQYSVVEEQPDGFFEGNAKAGSSGGEVQNGSRIANVNLEPGETAVDYDFCERPGSEIQGMVFADRDDDCRFDSGETAIEGVRVELYDADGKLIATAATDSGGNYRFTNLPKGTYTVREVQPAGWIHGGQRAGTAGGDDLTPDVIARVPVGWGERLTHYDFCELEPASISGVVLVDGNGDCLRDADEPPIEGVTIELRDANGHLVANTVTDAEGRYTFDNLRPGDYQVFERQPDGFLHGGQRPGSGDGVVLGADLLGVRLLAGEQLDDYNFCEIEPASISGHVYVDDDGDCERDPEEEPLEGVIVELRNASGKVIVSTTTDADGLYEFSGLGPGQYELFEHQPDGFFHGGQTVGTGVGRVLADDHFAVDLSPGESLTDYDFCETPPASIGGRVWQESEPNRQFEPGDTPLSGVRIELVNDNGDVIAETKTDGAGNYRFERLAPGSYSVHEVQPSGLFHGGEVVGDSGGNVGGDDLIIGIHLSGGTHANHYDFPEIPPARLSGYVFQDGDAISLAESPNPEDLRIYRDGVLTSDDARLSGVTIELRNILGLPFDASRALAGTYTDGPIQVVTDAEGYYEFTGLRPGTYHVYQVQPADYIDGLDTAGTTGGVAVNPADIPNDDDRILIQTLAFSEQTDPRDDAILNIALKGGATSEENNFSEIVVETPPPPPPPPLPPPPPPVNPPGSVNVVAPPTIDPGVQLIAYVQPPQHHVAASIIDEWAVSWHLSVINGGYPRGTLDDDGIVRSGSAGQTQGEWNDASHSQGTWTIVKRDGTRVEVSKNITLGAENATALAGDFDGDGADEAAIFVGGQWFVDLNGNGRWDPGDLWIRLGTLLDRPVVGDWDGDGKDDIGIFGRQWQRDPQKIKKDPGLPDPANMRRRQVDPRTLVSRDEDRGEDRQRILRNGTDGSLRADAVDHVFQYGEQVDTPISGDWNGDGIDQIAVFRSGLWLLDADGDGRWTDSDTTAEFGRSGDEPIVGDFNGDNIDEIGVVRGDLWIIDTDGDRRITGNDLRIVVPRSGDDSQPVVGDFDGDGEDDPGYYDEAA